ncbi:MAG: hypothetical protein WBD20_16050 [Pirellulaceae bacterium]
MSRLCHTLKFAVAFACIMHWQTVTHAHEPTIACEVWNKLPSTHLVSRHCDVLRPQRIVIVTTQDRQDRLKEQQAFVQSLAHHLGRGRKFDVIVSRDPMCCDRLPMRQGTFDELQLLQISQKYRADCVLYCNLESMSAYAPMQAEMSMLLVNVAESIALVSAKCNYDMRDVDTKQEYLDYVQQPSSDAESALNVSDHTPSQFIDFAAYHFATGILSVW